MQPSFLENRHRAVIPLGPDAFSSFPERTSSSPQKTACRLPRLEQRLPACHPQSFSSTHFTLVTSIGQAEARRSAGVPLGVRSLLSWAWTYTSQVKRAQEQRSRRHTPGAQRDQMGMAGPEMDADSPSETSSAAPAGQATVGLVGNSSSHSPLFQSNVTHSLLWSDVPSGSSLWEPSRHGVQLL